MDRFEAAEKMHLRAIEIKEEILGKEDYEVALSVGHLASLYNYDMKQHLKAEKLYLRSIKIGRKLFGPTYSGLEYDYRGLIQVSSVVFIRSCTGTGIVMLQYFRCISAPMTTISILSTVTFSRSGGSQEMLARRSR